MNPLANLVYRLNHAWLWITRPLTVGVRLILVRDGQVMLVRHTYQNGWLLPGGGVKRGETAEAALRREAQEEVGATLGTLTLHGVYTNFFEYKSDHVIVFACQDFELLPDRPLDRMEIECYDFFPLNNLPADLMPGHRRRLEEFRSSTSAAGWGMW